MGTVQSQSIVDVVVTNDSNTDISTISVSSVDDFDWAGGRPYQFNGVFIGVNKIVGRRLAINPFASHCPFNMTLHFRNGDIDTFRIHAVGCCGGFQHIQKSHNIYYERGHEKIMIKIENTKEQLQNERAEERNKEGQVAMRKKQYETAIKKFDEALKLAHKSSTITSIKDNKNEACNKHGESLLQKAWELEADKTQDKSQEAQNMFVAAKDMFQQAGIVKHTSEQQENLNLASMKVEGNELFNKAIEVEKAAFEVFETARKSNENDDYKAAENKYKEALNTYEAAKKKFDEGSKIESEKFGDCAQLTNDRIEDVKKVLNGIDKIELTCNISKVAIEERQKEEMKSQVGINRKIQEQVDVAVD
jgi:tetratricopeptide (TPR) repeat protein